MRTQLPLPLSGLAILLIAGCTSSTSENEPRPAAPPAPKPNNAVSTGNKNDTAAFDAWAQALTRWSQGAQTPATAPPPVKDLAVYVDIAALARRHPAWRLADTLNRSAEPQAAEAFMATRVPQVAIPAQRGGTGSLAGFTPFGGDLAPGTSVRAAARIPGLQDRAEGRQNFSLDAFLRTAAEEQQQEREAKADSLAAALAENIDAARRPDLPDISPAFPADPIQLEMTNLRLQLLENTRLSAAEKEAAQQRLVELEGKWREALREQEDARVAELARLREETPRRLRAEGESRIDRQIQADAARDLALRTTVRDAQRERIANDFRASDRTLGILLPGVTNVSRQTVEAGQKEAARGGNGAIRARQAKVPYNLNETFVAGLSSTGGGPSQTAARQAEITALRRRALSEAGSWAKIIARRNGWRLQPASAGINKGVDKTAETARLLKWG